MNDTKEVIVIKKSGYIQKYKWVVDYSNYSLQSKFQLLKTSKLNVFYKNGTPLRNSIIL